MFHRLLTLATVVVTCLTAVHIGPMAAVAVTLAVIGAVTVHAISVGRTHRIEPDMPDLTADAEHRLDVLRVGAATFHNGLPEWLATALLLAEDNLVQARTEEGTK